MFFQAPFLLPLLLYCLGKKICPTLKLYILEAMPKIATHKVSIEKKRNLAYFFEALQPCSNAKVARHKVSIERKKI